MVPLYFDSVCRSSSKAHFSLVFTMPDVRSQPTSERERLLHLANVPFPCLEAPLFSEPAKFVPCLLTLHLALIVKVCFCDIGMYSPRTELKPSNHFTQVIKQPDQVVMTIGHCLF